MEKEQLREFEELLHDRRRKLLHELGYLQDSVMNTSPRESSGDLSSYSDHMADMGTDSQEREKAFMFASKEGRLLYHIDEALRRIQDGSYGKCVQCGVDINPNRLRAVPHARMCIKCKSEEEMQRRG